MSIYTKERSNNLQDKVKRLIAANALLREELKAKDKRIAELESQCATCECARFADEAIKPSMALKLHMALHKK